MYRYLNALVTGLFEWICINVLCIRYLNALLDYLSSYISRLHPLLDQNALQQEVMQMFREKWQQGNFPGWRVREGRGGEEGGGEGKREGIMFLVVVRYPH